jgi:hypothetical protein
VEGRCYAERVNLRGVWSKVTFRVVERDEVVSVDDLHELAAAMNRSLATLGFARRIYDMETGMDACAFLARTPSEVEALTADVPLKIHMDDGPRRPIGSVRACL